MQTYSDLAKTSSQAVTQAYSTSFYSSVSMLDPSIQSHIHNIYGFVRLADEIVDSFLDYDQEALFDKFESDLYDAIIHKISLNPVWAFDWDQSSGPVNSKWPDPLWQKARINKGIYGTPKQSMLV